jgi:hypothetical protein
MGPSGLFGSTPTPGIGMGGGAMGASPAGMGGMGFMGGMPMSGGGGELFAPRIENQMVRQQPAPQQMQQQQRAMSPLMQQQMMRQQQPMFNPMQQMMMRQQQQPRFNQMQQQFRPQQQFQQQQMGGLQAALMQMLGQYNQPMQRQQFMPQYQNQALQYRPDMTQAQQSLSRVAPSVQEQQRLAEEAAAKARSGMFGSADEDAAFQDWQRQQYQQYRNAQSGGGG